MADLLNTRVVLASYPSDFPTRENFRIERISVQGLQPGEVLLRTRYVSVDAHMRRHDPSGSFGPPSLSPGDVIEADATGEVLASNDSRFRPAEVVLAKTGWQTHAIVQAGTLQKVSWKEFQETAALALLGTPALVAYSGLTTVGNPQPGETLVVPAALGATGAMVGQLARIAGAWTVGIVSGQKEIAFARNELGFNTVVDHTSPDFARRLSEACPDGIDVYFETIGGALWDIVRPMLNYRARVVLSGTPAQYNHRLGGARQYQDPSTMQLLIERKWTIGAIPSTTIDFERFTTDMREALRTGGIRFRIEVVEGLRLAAEAWLTAIDGPNYGTKLVHVAEDE